MLLAAVVLLALLQHQAAVAVDPHHHSILDPKLIGWHGETFESKKVFGSRGPSQTVVSWSPRVFM